MFLKREVRRKDGKEHVYDSLAESTRVGRDRVVQRRLLNLGELNTTQIDRWQRSIEVIEEDGRARQRRLFSDREGQAPQQEEDVCEVVLSSLSVRRPRSLGDCWLGCRLWEELGLDSSPVTREHHCSRRHGHSPETANKIRPKEDFRSQIAHHRKRCFWS